MQQMGNIQPEPIENGQDRSYEEQVREMVRQIRNHLEQGDIATASAFFSHLYPVDQGDLLAELGEEQRQSLLARLAPHETADILEHIETEEALEMSEALDVATLSEILDETSPDVAADILKELPDEQSIETLEAMEAAEDVIPLLQYLDDSAGGLMTPDYPSIRVGTTAVIALDQLRLLSLETEDIHTVFVVDEERRLVGTLDVIRLALARPTVIVNDIMKPETISVTVETDQEDCARLMERYDLDELPVADQDGRLVGIILAEDLVDVVQEEATEDMFRIAGLGEERVFGPLRGSLRSRLPWLFVNLATAFLAASVVSLFESTIARVVALAAFLPVVAGQGGIGGTQTVTLVVRSMALGDVPAGSGLRLLLRELTLGTIHGLLLGLIVGVIGYLWKGTLILGVVLGVAMVGNMIIAGLTGAGVPLVLRRLRVDPAVSSSVFVTTFTDVFGFLLFLGLAAIFITSLA